MIRVLLVEDQGLLLGALAALLGLESDLQVQGTAADAAAALELLDRHDVDVLITDIELPGMSGLELAAHVTSSHPSVKVMILTTFARPGYLRRAMDAGARGYLLKDAPASQLADAIRRVHAGGRAVEAELAAAAWGEADPLTERERQVLRRAAEGSSSAAIAAELQLSEGTVRNYLSEAISKLGAGNRIEAARIARDNGWL